MTKEAIKKTLEETLTRNGFAFNYIYCDWLPIVIQSSDDYAGISFMSTMDYDMEAGMLIEKITCQSRVCHINPTATVEELIAAAEQITRAAKVMSEINAMGLAIMTSIPVKEAR